MAPFKKLQLVVVVVEVIIIIILIILIIINNRNTAHVECKNKGDTSNNRGDWDYFKVI